MAGGKESKLEAKIMTRLTYLLFLLFMNSCFESNETISSRNITALEISVIKFPKKDTLYSRITNVDSIHSILRKLNDGNEKLIKFYATCRITVLYSDGRENLVSCSGSSMKVDGVTYRLAEDIQNIIGY